MIKNILCADIGGTNSRFAHFELENDALRLCNIYTCNTNTLHSTHDVLYTASKALINISHAHINIWGVAGPISNTYQASLSNSNLSLDFKDFSKNNKMLLVNDFSLQAFATLANNLETINITHNKATNIGTRAIIGAGTGLGTAALIPINTTHWITLNAEGGHTDMPIYGSDELNFAKFAKSYLKQNTLSAEDILSARGLSLINAYITGKNHNPMQVAKILLENNNESEQLKIYARFLGRFCRNFALNTLCYGGLYLGGGVLSKNPYILKCSSFLSEFYTCPRAMQDSIKKIPISLMLHEHAALWGAAYLAKQCLQKNA